MARLRSGYAHFDYRQVVVLDRHGGTAGHSEARTLGTHRVNEAEGVAAAGNLLSSPDVTPKKMVEAFLARADDHIGDRVIAAMQAAVDAGGGEYGAFGRDAAGLHNRLASRGSARHLVGGRPDQRARRALAALAAADDSLCRPRPRSLLCPFLRRTRRHMRFR